MAVLALPTHPVRNSGLARSAVHQPCALGKPWAAVHASTTAYYSCLTRGMVKTLTSRRPERPDYAASILLKYTLANCVQSCHVGLYKRPIHSHHTELGTICLSSYLFLGFNGVFLLIAFCHLGLNLSMG